MSRRFTAVTLALTAIVAFLVGAIAAGGVGRSSVRARAPTRRIATEPRIRAAGAAAAVTVVNFADVVEKINPAVVNIEATTRMNEPGKRRRSRPELPDVAEPGMPRNDRDNARRGVGTGFIIDADGSILTNNHVIEGADRIIVKLSDGRSLRARVLGADPDTNIAVIKVDGQGLPVAPIGDSSALRMGEWVCAIGNPLG